MATDQSPLDLLDAELANAAEATGHIAARLSLKRFVHNARMSQETNAFVADVWCDGKRVGSASNAGHGGETMVVLDDASLEAEVKSALSGAAKPCYEYYGLTNLIDTLVDTELNRLSTKRQFDRFSKRCGKLNQVSVLSKNGLMLAAGAAEIDALIAQHLVGGDSVVERRLP